MSAARSRSSRVDATLFATKRPKSNPTFSSSLSSSSSKNGGASQAVVSSTLLKKLTGKQANAKESTVITKNDLEAIQHAVGYSNNSSANPADVATTAAFSTTSSIAALRGSGAPSSAKSATISARAKARKEKMLAIDRERKDLGGDMLDTFQQEEEKQRSEVLHRARGALDEELDDVKHMNQMILYAKCVTIRDAQIVEKRKREEEAIDEEKRLDIAMEIERIKTLKMLEEREEARKLEQRLGAQVIIKQIEEREAERIRQQEMREQEAQAMVQRVRELELREEEERKEKVLAGRKLLQGVMEANNAQARAKLRKKQEEIEEEQRIAEYIRAKEARERDEEERKEKDRSDKEREIARLRAMQEKAQDRQAAMDELRAKRYQEAKDRKWREQQLESAQKKEGMKREIALAREMQRQEKARRIAEQALQERDEYMRVLEWQKQQTEIDKKKEDSQKAAALRHREELLSQIREHEKSRDDARKMYLSEGKVIASQMEGDKQKLLRIKESKLGELEKAGVPEKYRTELAKYKVLVASIH